MSYLVHHGIDGQKWGVKNGPPYPLSREVHERVVLSVPTKKKLTDYTGAKTPNELFNFSKGIKYSEYSKLMSPEEVIKKKKGSCHDLTMLNASELERMGLNPVCIFVMEYDKKSSQSGMTHSFCTYKDGKVINWLEPANTWPDKAGVNSYTSLNAIVKAIKRAHSMGEFGDSKTYGNIEITSFDYTDHSYGEDLQDFVNICIGD